MGHWVINDSRGIRSYPYSTSATRNPLRYSSIGGLNEVHDIGEVWARRTSELAQNVVVGLFPTWSATIEPATVSAADEFLAGDEVPTALRRLVSEGRADVERALRAREVDTAAG